MPDLRFNLIATGPCTCGGTCTATVFKVCWPGETEPEHLHWGTLPQDLTPAERSTLHGIHLRRLHESTRHD